MPNTPDQSDKPDTSEEPGTTETTKTTKTTMPAPGDINVNVNPPADDSESKTSP